MAEENEEEELAEIITSVEKDEQEKKAHIFPQVKCSLIVSLGSLIGASIGSWTGATLTQMNEDFQMSTTQSSFVVALFNYGALVGSFISAKISDAFGRKKTILVASPLAVCSWIAIGMAPDVNVVCFGRFLGGVSSGLYFTSISIYTSEICQPSLRGRLGSIPSLTITFGILLAFVLGGLFNWKTSAFLCIIPCIFLFIGLLFIPESPYWFLLKGNQRMATENLRKLRGPDYNVEKEIQEMMRKLSDVGENINYREFLKRRTFIPLLLSLFIQNIHQLTGGNVITLYASNIFQSAKSSINEQMGTIYTGISQMIGTVVSMLIIDKCGRKILLFVSLVCCGIFSASLGAYYVSLEREYMWSAWLPLVILLCYMFFFCLGCRSIPWLIRSEIFNTSIRSRAMAISVCYNRVLGLLVAQGYPFVAAAVGEGAVFLSYGVICMLFATGTLLFVPETKGKSLEEIQDYFEGRAPLKKPKRQSVNA